MTAIRRDLAICCAGDMLTTPLDQSVESIRSEKEAFRPFRQPKLKPKLRDEQSRHSSPA
jgi:hypothetical protein